MSAMVKVEFSVKTSKDDANPVLVKTELDFSKLTPEEILEMASQSAVIDLQRRIRSGAVSVDDRPARLVDDKEIPAKIGIQGRVYEVPKPGTRAATKDPLEAIKAMAKKLGISMEQLAAMAEGLGANTAQAGESEENEENEEQAEA